MPPKPKKTPKPQRGVPAGQDPASLTKEAYEAELRDLALKARSETPLKHLLAQGLTLVKVLTLLSLAAASSHASQLNLSPVYGSIPSGIYHDYLVFTGCFLGYAGAWYLQRTLPCRMLNLLPVLALYIPMVQNMVFPLSTLLGAIYGPVVTEALTFLPLLILTTACATHELVDLDVSFLPGFIRDAGPGIGAFVFFRWVGGYLSGVVAANIGTSFITTRVGLEVFIAFLYALLAPSRLLLLALPAVLHTGFLNSHVQSTQGLSLMSQALEGKGWKVLARQDSLTGYISVLENQEPHFRVLRCDHSLLGGEWLSLPDGTRVTAREPIYAIFAMLEAVRLVDVPVKIQDKDAKALVIGLGVGTTPGAFINHGINTTIVEIDPVVYQYAIEYFGLPLNHNAVVADAVTYAADLAKEGGERFDYIIHDVFTGGAEPAELFTEEFLKDLHAALKPEGIIAINYASDLLLPSTASLLATVSSIFPTCRLFRETDPPEITPEAPIAQDFTNLVIFCRASSTTPITFRKSTQKDFLGSGARHQYLVPKHEVFAEDLAGGGGGKEGKEGEEGNGVLKRGELGKVVEEQRKSAVGHWGLMRTVVEAGVWDLW